jgi:WD40 repeat protein
VSGVSGLGGVVYDNSGKHLATGSRAGDVRLFDVQSRQEIAHYRDHDGEVYAVRFSPDGRWLASVDKAGAMVMRDLGSKLTLRWSSLPGAHGMEYSPDGRWVAVAGATPHLWLCAVPDGACSELRGHDSIVRGMRFTPDSRFLVSGGGDGETLVWDVQSREYRIFRGHHAPIFDVDVSPDGAWIATGSGDATVRLWPTVPPPSADNLATTLDALTKETVPDIIPRGPGPDRAAQSQRRH